MRLEHRGKLNGIAIQHSFLQSHAEKPSQALKAILPCCQIALFPAKLNSLN